MKVRPAMAQDASALELLAKTRTYNDSLFLTATQLRDQSVQNLREILPRLEELPHWRLLVAVEDERLVGFLMLAMHDVEVMTEEEQSEIVDFVAPSFEVLEALVAPARQQAADGNDQFLVVRLHETEKRHQIWYYRLGFRAEYNRVVKIIVAGQRGPTSSRYQTRPAREEDRAVMIRLNAAYCGIYGAAGREPRPDAIRTFFYMFLSAADFLDPDYRYIVLDDLQTGRLSGYIILQRQPMANPDQLGYFLLDVAVALDCAGRGLSAYLIGAADTFIGQCGGGLLFGDTSPSNLAGVNGNRQLGCIIDSKRWGISLGSPFHAVIGCLTDEPPPGAQSKGREGDRSPY